MQIYRLLSRGIAAMILCLGTVGLLAVTAAAQNGFQSGSTGADGALVFSIPPNVGSGYAMAYDAARQVVVLFGWSGTVDTWEWDNTRWIKKTPPNAPSPRRLHAMVYDSARQVVVLFGGIDLSRVVGLNDTWEYDGTTWTQRTPATAPSARYGHAMAYDSTRQVTVLFGGERVRRIPGSMTGPPGRSAPRLPHRHGRQLEAGPAIRPIRQGHAASHCFIRAMETARITVGGPI